MSSISMPCLMTVITSQSSKRSSGEAGSSVQVGGAIRSIEQGAKVDRALVQVGL